MSRSKQIKRILQRFPTEGYKQFSYQTRPFFTVGMAVFLLALGWFQIVNLAVIYWILAAFVLDNVALTPIMNALRAVNHLYYGRKKFKSTVILAAVITALILGAVLGYFVMAPLISKFLLDYIALTGCSPFLISMGAMLGGYISHATHKIPLFWGIFIGSCLASVVYIPIPIMIEVVYFSAIALAFVTTVATKQALRLYFQKHYGHTNADGYDLTRTAREQDDFIEAQAKQFQISPQEFYTLTQHCRKKITEIKRDSKLWEEYMNIRIHTTNSYKDIYHGLMNPHLTPETVRVVKEMIGNSNLPPELNTAENRKKVTNSLRAGTFFNPNVEQRTLVHQFQIFDSGGLDPKLLTAFRPR
ncbi:MAG: hypothetical protein NTU48_01630 [Legionellales bacterium]|nr:hypothetical protein [Legionellales bacterium]